MPLIKFALLTAILGTSILLFLSQVLEPKLIGISDINNNLLEQGVRVRGSIASFRSYKSMAIFSLQDESGKIFVIAYNLKENLSGNVEVIGRIKEYQGEMEIEANKIKKL